MARDSILYVGRDYQGQDHLGRHLRSLGIELQKAPSVPAAKKTLQEHPYGSVLIHFDTVCERIFDFCSFVQTNYPRITTMVLIPKAEKKIEKRLFGCGVNDIVSGTRLTKW